MSARTTHSSKITTSTEGSTSKPRTNQGKGRTARATSSGGKARRGASVAKYATPAVAALASGALAATSYIFKEELGHIFLEAMQIATRRGAKVASATSQAATTAGDQIRDTARFVGDQLSIDPLLQHAGLQRRSTLRAIMMPAIGAACGLVAGSVLTQLFGTAILRQLKNGVPQQAAPADEAPTEARVEGPARSLADDLRANGGLHGRTS